MVMVELNENDVKIKDALLKDIWKRCCINCLFFKVITVYCVHKGFNKRIQPVEFEFSLEDLQQQHL